MICPQCKIDREASEFWPQPMEAKNAKQRYAGRLNICRKCAAKREYIPNHTSFWGTEPITRKRLRDRLNERVEIVS